MDWRRRRTGGWSPCPAPCQATKRRSVTTGRSTYGRPAHTASRRLARMRRRAEVVGSSMRRWVFWLTGGSSRSAQRCSIDSWRRTSRRRSSHPSGAAVASVLRRLGRRKASCSASIGPDRTTLSMSPIVWSRAPRSQPRSPRCGTWRAWRRRGSGPSRSIRRRRSMGSTWSSMRRNRSISMAEAR